MSGSFDKHDEDWFAPSYEEIPQITIGSTPPADGYSVTPEYAPMLIEGLRPVHQKLLEIDS